MGAAIHHLAFEAERVVAERCTCLRCGGVLTPLRRSKDWAKVRCARCTTEAQVEAVSSDGAFDATAIPLAKSRAVTLDGAPVDLFVACFRMGERDPTVFGMPAFQDRPRVVGGHALRLVSNRERLAG